MVKNNILWIQFCSLILSTAYLSAMDNAPSYQSVLLPGQNGLGGASLITNKIIATPTVQKCRTLETPYLIDLGQKNCIADFQKQLNNSDINRSKLLLYGVSQGTATLTNWLAQKSHEEQEASVGCLVLEAVLGSGNSAIMHTVGNVPLVTYIPFSRIWIPLIAKAAAFPTYNPYGQALLGSAKKISPNIPVIIMHHGNDPQLSINDAREAYCTLRNNGNENAYLFEVNNNYMAHFDILDTENDEEKQNKLNSIQAIYQKHGLPTRSVDTSIKIDPKYQPPVREVLDKLNKSTRTSRILRNTIDIGALGIIAYSVYKLRK